MTTTRRGRPPSFSRSAALEQALALFWERGYEATSIADLTAAMGIGAPSLYAAFSSKRELFNEVVALYAQTYRAFMARALAEEPTLEAGIERMLREAAAAYTLPGHPRGCLVIDAATNCSSPEVRRTLRELRNASLERLERRIEVAIEGGELASDADARTLALSTSVLMQGMAHQARDGVERSELEAVAGLAIRAWPWTAPRPEKRPAGASRRRESPPA